jgi:hypothetical protein
MAVLLWACPLVIRRGMSLPKVVEILDSFGPHVTSWSTTPGHRAAPYAAGCSEVTEEQQAALAAEAQVFIWTEPEWQQQFDQLPAAFRNRLNQFCNQIGVTRPLNNEVIRDIVTRLTTLIDNKPIEDHVGQVSKQRGS